MSEFELQGFDDLEFYLSTFSDKVEKRLLKGALTAGALVIKKQAKRNAPSKTGRLRKSIRHRRLKGNRAVVQIYAAAGKKEKNDGWYAHIIEGGAKAHKIRGRNGKGLKLGNRVVNEVNHPGIKAKPFMGPALDTQATAAVIAVGSRLAQMINRELSK